MAFDFQTLVSGESLDQAAGDFERDGWIQLTGLDTLFIDLFKPIVGERLQVSPHELDRILEPNAPAIVLPEETRKRMSRIDTPPDLAEALLALLTPILLHLTGPFQQVSSNFHGQFKGGDTTTTNYGGYHGETGYREVHRPYLIHQDFTAAAIPTSPGGLTLWTPLNACPDWTLRLWPGSHRYGMLCRNFPALDDPGLSAFRPHVDVEAKPGTAVLFNAMLLHATSNPGQRRRVSCDIRFFPLTGFVPSRPRTISDRPMRAIREGLERHATATLRAPLCAALAFLDRPTTHDGIEPLSILNWAEYITVLRNDGAQAALPHLVRMVNTDKGWEPPEVYIALLHDRPIHAATIDAARGFLEPDVTV